MDDSHARAVHAHLVAKGVEVALLEWEKFGVDWLASWHAPDSSFIIDTKDRTFDLRSIGSWWMRRDPVLPDREPTDPLGQYIDSQTILLHRWMLHWLARVRPGVDPLSNVIAASSKPLQQMIASQCGLTVPETLCGNSPDRAFDWMNSVDGSLCIKALEAGRIHFPDGRALAHYTSPFERRSREELNSLADCPATLQTFVTKKLEYRVTVIGTSVLACSIDTSQASGDAQVDWRHYDWANTVYRRDVLPSRIDEGLLAVLRSLGLRYGAFDLILTDNDDFVFLEVNPSGQFLWIEDLTDLPITATMADYLLSICSE